MPFKKRIRKFTNKFAVILLIILYLHRLFIADVSSLKGSHLQILKAGLLSGCGEIGRRARLRI